MATFSTIFGTNILIQCPVSVPVFCMFYVSQKTNIKRSPNGKKRTENYFGIFVNFRRKNQRETVSEVATRQGGAPTPWVCPGLSWATRKAVDALLFPQET